MTAVTEGAPTTELATLPPAARAAVVLKSEKTRAELAELVKKSKGIVTVANKDGREECHRAYMNLKNTRVAITHRADEATEDAKAFTKAVKAEAASLIEITEAEEERLQALRDAWDERIEAEKAAKIAAERARVEAIQARIDALRSAPLSVVGKPSVVILTALDAMRATVIDESFEEFAEQATAVHADALAALESAHAAAVEAEEAARAAEEARKAELARIEAERAELAKLRAEQAERERIAKAEADRIAAEQAAEARRLEQARREQEAELQRQRDAEAARVRAEEEARAAAVAEQQRQLAEQQAAIDAQRVALEREQAEARERAEAAARLESDHAEALQMNAQFDVDREAERARLQTLADQALTVARERADDERKAGLPAGSLRPAEVIDGPSDDEILSVVCATFDLHPLEAIDRLAAIDFAAAREQYKVAA
jgi:hypothetical protein